MIRVRVDRKKAIARFSSDEEKNKFISAILELHKKGIEVKLKIHG